MFIRLGQKKDFGRDLTEGFNIFLINVFGQKKLLKDPKSGIMHLALFYGFLLVQFGAIDLIWKGLKPGSHLPLGSIYYPFLFTQEIVVSVILISIFYAYYRRNIEKLSRLKRGWKANLVVWLISILMISTLLSEAMEIIWLHPDKMHFQPTQPIASSLANLFSFIAPVFASFLFYIYSKR